MSYINKIPRGIEKRFSPLRRGLLRVGGVTGLSLAAGASPWSSFLSDARAGDYKALVCVFLNGGNDGNDTLIPVDAAYNDYAQARGAMALPKDSLVTLAGTHNGSRYAMHPGLRPLATMFDAGRLAWVTNVGPLVAPLTISDARALRNMPPYLMSHSDQVAAQQGWLYSDDQSGWGGRAIEALPAALRGKLANVSIADTGQLATGQQIAPRRVLMKEWTGAWGSADLKSDTNPATPALRALFAPTFSDQVEASYAQALREASDDATSLATAFGSAIKGTEFPATAIGEQLKQVAQMISVRQQVAAVRQVFLIDWGSFDTHSHQRGRDFGGQDGQLEDLGAALNVFDQSLKAQGVSGDVTTFMMTDMGRTLQPSGEAGTDHAWANHFFAFGDAVKGGKLYGTFPELRLGGADDYDFERRGRFMPTTATDQFAATLVSWLGVPANQIATVFPNLAGFSSSNLGFL